VKNQVITVCGSIKFFVEKICEKRKKCSGVICTGQISGMPDSPVSGVTWYDKK